MDAGTDEAGGQSAPATDTASPGPAPGDDPPDDTGAPPPDGPDFRPRVAAVRVTDAPPMLAGYLYEAALPWAYVEVGRDGPCRALSLGVPRCDPPCAGGDLCVGEDQCAPYPRLLSAGTLTVGGLPGVDTIAPSSPPVYTAAIGTLPGPADRVRVEAEGDEIGPFVLEVAGVTPLVLDPLPDRAPGEDLVLRWTPEPGSRIRARFAVDHAHRLAPEVVECEGLDEGELVVAADLIDRVMASPDWACGVCFGQSIERYRGDRADGGVVPVDLEVASVVGLPTRL